MDVYQEWTDRLTLTLAWSLRALGFAFMLAIFGWLLVAVFAAVRQVIPMEVAGTLLVGYVGGRLHVWWRASRLRALKTFRSEDSLLATRTGRAHLAAPSFVASKSDAQATAEAAVSAVKGSFADREMLGKEEESKRAAELTARQLQQAIEITESKVGKERADSDGALVGSVLEVLATNYRLATR